LLGIDENLTRRCKEIVEEFLDAGDRSWISADFLYADPEFMKTFGPRRKLTEAENAVFVDIVASTIKANNRYIASSTFLYGGTRMRISPRMDEVQIGISPSASNNKDHLTRRVSESHAVSHRSASKTNYEKRYRRRSSIYGASVLSSSLNF
jgi:hypothetical protein